MSGGPKIDREPTRTILIRELATAEATQAELGARHGVDQSTVSSFSRRHAGRIEAVRAKLDDEFAGFVYAAKANRIAVLGQQVDDIADILARVHGGEDVQEGSSESPGGRRRRGSMGGDTSTAELMRVQAVALRAIADELGQIPARMTVEHTGGLDVRINGVDLDDLT